MKLTKLTPTLPFAMLIAITGAGRVNADVIQCLSPVDLLATDNIFIDPDSYTVYSSPSVSFTTANNTLTWWGSGADEMYFSATAGSTYLGTAFPDGIQIFEAGGDMGTTAGGAVTLSFASPVQEFGLNTEEYNSGPYVVQFTVFDGATSLGTYSANGNDTFDSSGVLSFESALATGSDVITSVVFDDSAAGGSNNLAFGPVTYDNGPVATEPPTLITLGVGLISCGLLRRRRIAQ